MLVPTMTVFSCFILFTVLFLQALLEVKSAANIPCAKRKTDNGYVCVCNATYCDTIEAPTQLAMGRYILYSTSNNTPGFRSSTGEFNVHSDAPVVSNITVTVNSGVAFQTMNGIGGAFTDSFCINVRNLSSVAQENLLKSYFSTSGIEYTLARVPVAGTDCSPKVYTYDDYPNDEDLSHFNLSSYDYDFRIPVIRRAMQLSSRGVSLIASAWSGPTWMKSNNAITPGYILPKYYQLWTDYMIRFFDEYKKNELTFWAMTTGNEPVYAFLIEYGFNNMVALPQLHRIWYKHYLYPSLKQSQHGNIKIITFDDQRMFVNWWVDRIMSDKAVADAVDGIGVQCYRDNMASAEMLDILREKYKNKFIINTEFCFVQRLDNGPFQIPGSWKRAAYYANTIMENINHWSTGYLDWNMAVNTEGGPLHIPGGLEAPIVVDAEKDEFFKNPIFYILGHFSKFIHIGSFRIQSLSEPADIKANIQHLAMKNPDGSNTVFLFNQEDVDMTLTVRDLSKGDIHFTAEANSMNTIVYW